MVSKLVHWLSSHGLVNDVWLTSRPTPSAPGAPTTRPKCNPQAEPTAGERINNQPACHSSTNSCCLSTCRVSHLVEDGKWLVDWCLMVKLVGLWLSLHVIVGNEAGWWFSAIWRMPYDWIGSFTGWLTIATPKNSRTRVATNPKDPNNHQPAQPARISQLSARQSTSINSNQHSPTTLLNINQQSPNLANQPPNNKQPANHHSTLPRSSVAMRTAVQVRGFTTRGFLFLFGTWTDEQRPKKPPVDTGEEMVGSWLVNRWLIGVGEQ